MEQNNLGSKIKQKKTQTMLLETISKSDPAEANKKEFQPKLEEKRLRIKSFERLKNKKMKGLLVTTQNFRLSREE